MPIVASSGPTFTPAPSGTHAAVCCDVIDLGTVTVTYANATKKQHKVWICWQIAEDQDDGKPFLVRKRYTLSLHEKSSLRKDLESWRGRAFTEEELKGFDLEVLISVPALLNIIHAAKGGSTYANVASIMRLPKSMPAPTIRKYVRECDRDPNLNPPIDEARWGEITDDDVPF